MSEDLNQGMQRESDLSELVLPKGEFSERILDLTLAFDLDGTIYDSFEWARLIANAVLEKIGSYAPATCEEYRNAFDMHDLFTCYRKLGVKSEADIRRAIKVFDDVRTQFEPPKLIPGARDIVAHAVNNPGIKNLFVVSNAHPDEVKFRFARDGLNLLLPHTVTSSNGKANQLYALASMDGRANKPFVYVGDLVSDGQACLEARTAGAKNVFFYGMTHEYMMNSKGHLREYIAAHPDFSLEIPALSELYSNLFKQF